MTAPAGPLPTALVFCPHCCVDRESPVGPSMDGELALLVAITDPLTAESFALAGECAQDFGEYCRSYCGGNEGPAEQAHRLLLAWWAMTGVRR